MGITNGPEVAPAFALGLFHANKGNRDHRHIFITTSIRVYPRLQSVALTTTALGAVAHVIPNIFPLPPPLERAATNRADFAGTFTRTGHADPLPFQAYPSTTDRHRSVMDQTPIKALVKHCAAGLFDLACAVSGHPEWDLSLPVGVIDARHKKPRLTVTPIGTINTVLRASTTTGRPLMRRFFERMKSIGLEQALTELRRSTDEETFAALWEAYREEQLSGNPAMWSIEEATAFVVNSRSCHRDQAISCVAILPGDPHEIVTFSVPIRFLTSP